MFKISTIIFLLFWITVLSSCRKDFVKLPPNAQLGGDPAYANLTGVQALTASLYDKLSIAGYEDFDFATNAEAAYPSQWVDEAVRSYTWGAPSEVSIIPDGTFPWWDYGIIRQQNDFIEKIPRANINDKDKAGFLAEIRFLRAFTYFAMVKRYGGVPLVTQVLSPTADNASLQIPRNTEQAVYDFIASEADDIISKWPDSYSGASDPFRATKYAVLALKCRAMLYAASEAKYGNLQLNGLVGIPASSASGYWQKAYDAAQVIISSGKYQLYRGDADPAKNFQQLFNGADPTTNKEAIFLKAYALPTKGHSFDFYNQPNPFWTYYSSVTNPVVEMVEDFEYTDGTPGKLKIKDDAGVPRQFSNPADLFKNKDPRFFATIFYPNVPWQVNNMSMNLEIRRGIVNGRDTLVVEDLNQSYGTPPNSITYRGASGPVTAGDATKTGFYLRKYLTQNTGFIPGSQKSSQPWLIFRYGEVLLNYAEAAMELGRQADALDAINQIRSRAGIKTLTNVTIDQIRHERKVELAFENHRYWDLRRWHIADQVLNNTSFHALFPYLNWVSNTSPVNMKYSFTIVPIPIKPARTFPPRLYYEKISTGGANSYLVQNPGY